MIVWATDAVVLLACSRIFESSRLVAFFCLTIPMVAAVLGGTYRRPRLTLSTLSDLKSMVITASIPLIIVSVFDLERSSSAERHYLPLVVILALPLSRVLSSILLRRLRQARRGLPTLVIGSGVIADQIVETLREDRSFGLDPVGFVDRQSESPATCLVPRLGRLTDFDDVLRTENIRCVIVAFSAINDVSVVKLLRAMRPYPVEFFVVPRLFEFGASSGDVRTEDCGGIPLVWLPNRAWRPEHLAVKRLGDILMAATTLIVAAPVMVLTAIAVRVTSPGPVLFRQRRVGRHGEVFEMLKFRSMRHDPDAAPVQGGGGDPRITRVGRLIRKTSIDELPQLFNVLAGRMSMVGPRPELPEFVDEIESSVPAYGDRHRLQVGLTGWAQIHRLRGVGTSLEQRALFDNYYIDHWSLWRDVCIVLRTATVIVRGS